MNSKSYLIDVIESRKGRIDKEQMQHMENNSKMGNLKHSCVIN